MQKKLKRRELKFKTGMYVKFSTEVKRSLASMHNRESVWVGSFNTERTFYFREQLECTVAFYHGKIVAWCNWIALESDYCNDEYFSIYVKVKFRRRGIGTFLVRYVDSLIAKRIWAREENPDFFKHALSQKLLTKFSNRKRVLKKKGRNNGR